MVQILTDADVARSCTASRAVRVMRQAIAAHAEGRLAAPPRAYIQLETGPMVYTAGGLRKRVHGVRIYDYTGSEQAVAVWNSETGRLAALAIGDELGRRRTGAIGAVAIDTLARPDASTLGIVGTGDQAWAQIWAATAVRHWRRVVVYGRRFSAREAFAARCRDDLLVDAIAVDSAERAVRGRDVVIIATNSSTPVIDMSWITPGTHVTTLGPKSVTAHEMPLDLADRADLLVTDSLAQVGAYPEPYALPVSQLVELGAVMAGKAPGRRSRDQITVFCSVGLAGTEVVLAADLAGIANEPPQVEVRTQRHRAAPMDEPVDELGPEAVIPATAPAGEPAAEVAEVAATAADAAAPAEAVPADARPAEAVPADARSADARSADARPADAAPAEADPEVKPEIAAALRAAVAEMAAIPQPRVPAGGSGTAGAEPDTRDAKPESAGAGTAPAGPKADTESQPGPAAAGAAKAARKQTAAAKAEANKPATTPQAPSAGPNAGPAKVTKPSDLPQRRPSVPLPPGVRSAKDILAAAGQSVDKAAEAGTGPQPAENDETDSLKTLDEIFAFSDLKAISDRPATTDKPIESEDGKGQHEAVAEVAPGGQSNGSPAESKKPASKAPKEHAEHAESPEHAEHPGPPGHDTGAAAPVTPGAVAKVVSRRDAARVAGPAAGRNRGTGGTRGGAGSDRAGGPHRDRPSGSDGG